MTDSKGFTLLEVMISVAIFAIAAYLLSDFNQIYANDNYSMKRACEAHAAAIISAVQEQTYYMQIINPKWNTTVGGADNGTGNSNLTYSSSNFLKTKLLSNNNNYYLTGNVNLDHTIYYSPGGVSQYNGHYLIQGSLRTLAAIYNNFGTIQCKMGVYAPLTDGVTIPLPGILANLPTKPVIKVELDPYSLANHASVCGTGKLYPAPRNKGGGTISPTYNIFAAKSGTYTTVPITGAEISKDENTGHMSTSGIPIAVRAPNSNTDIGIGMTVQISYVMKNKSYSCSATQEFQYPEDDSPPPTPNLAKAENNSTLRPADPNRLIDYCDGSASTTTTTGSVTLEMGYTGQSLENGVELFCKDLSWRRIPTSTTYCKTTSGAKVFGQPYASNTRQFNMSGYQFTYNSSFGSRFAYWQPCQILTQCGKLPDSTASQINNDTLSFKNKYSNLPLGCVLNFEVIGIDTAGNRSGAMSLGATTNLFLSDQTKLTTTTSTPYGNKNFTVYQNEIYYPTCGKGDGSYYTDYHSGLGYYCPKYGYYNCNRWCGT